MLGRQAPANARARHPARERGQVFVFQAKAGRERGHFEQLDQLAHAAALLRQGQQPFDRMDQRTDGLRTQVGNVIGDETRIAALVLAKHSADRWGHDFDVGHHDHHVAWRQRLGRGVEPLQQLVVQHFEFAHRAVRHAERDRCVVLAQRLGWGAAARRLQVADAALQLREQTRAVFAGHIVKKVQARPLRDLLGRLQVVKSVELANEVASLPPPSGQERGRVQMHLRQRQATQRLASVGVTSPLGLQTFSPVDDVAPVVLARVGHGQQHLAVRSQRRQHLQQLPRHVAHAKHRHAPRHGAGQRLARLQVSQRPRMQRGAGGLALSLVQSGQHAPPQFGLPQLVFAQLIMPSSLAQHVAPGGPVLQPVGSVNLVLVKQVGQSTGQLQQAVRLVASQETRHGLEHRVLQAAGQQGHQPPGHGQFVERRVGRHVVLAQHLPVSAPQKARRQLHPRGRAHPTLVRQFDLDPLGHAVALHQHDFTLQRVQRVRTQPARQGVGQHLRAVAVQGNEAGRNGRSGHAEGSNRWRHKASRIAAIYPAAGSFC